MSNVKKMKPGQIDKKKVKESIKYNEDLILKNEEEIKVLKQGIPIQEALRELALEKISVLQNITLEVFNPKDSLEQSKEWLDIEKKSMIKSCEADVNATNLIETQTNNKISSLEEQNVRTKQNIEDLKTYL